MAMNRRDRLKAIFEDTMIRIKNTPYLNEATRRSSLQTKYYAPEKYPQYEIKHQTKGDITVIRHSTFEAVKRLHTAYPDKKIAVLNFASATNPGGGVVNGSSAQEECLCRCSTLYPTLTQKDMWNQYYLMNRAEHNALHNDACIYSPDIVVFKSDGSFPVIMPEKE
ncbi:MAG: TIGR02452 family protein [Ruminococcus sp.]|nr:TIGR02452 family protein [Ruminococcus sp.]